MGLLTILVCLLCLCVTSAYAQQPSAVRVHIAFDEASALAAAGQRAAVAEAAELWKPYGISVVAGPPDGCDPSVTIGTVADDARDQSGDLGSVQFGTDGIPDPRILLHYGSVVRLATGTAAFGVAAREWPLRLRDEVIARAVGRTLAHEIGHYVLQSPKHAESGLMRPRHRAAALAAPDRSEFVLTPPDVARLNIVMTAGVLAGRGAPKEGSVTAQAASTAQGVCAVGRRASASIP